MRITNALLILRNKLMRENFVITGIVLNAKDHEELARETGAPEGAWLISFLGYRIVRTAYAKEPAFCVTK